MKRIKIKIKKRKGCEDLSLPTYMTEGASGMDLFADIDDKIILNPGDIKLVSTGIFIELPYGFEAQIRPRSGLALRHGVTMANPPGSIDSDFRGLISVPMINLGKLPFTIKRGDRIAQMVINEIVKAEFELVDELNATKRDPVGFGSTGV